MFISGTCKVPLGSVLSKHWALPEFLPQSTPIHPQTCITYITCSSCIFCITCITCISCIPCITFITLITICALYCIEHCQSSCPNQPQYIPRLMTSRNNERKDDPLEATSAPQDILLHHILQFFSSKIRRWFLQNGHREYGICELLPLFFV